MTAEIKTKVTVCLSALLGALTAGYFIGRYSAPDKIKIETVTVTKEVVIQDESKRVNKTQRIIETTRPDGTTVKETRTKTRAASERTTTASRDATIKENKEIINRDPVSVSALVGLPLTDLTHGPVFGAAITRRLIGPFTIGVWGLTSLTFGLSVGVEL